MSEKYNVEYEETLECFLVIQENQFDAHDIVLTITWDKSDKEARTRAESKAYEVCQRLRSGEDTPEKYEQGHLEV
jgi:hypothetical protein